MWLLNILLLWLAPLTLGLVVFNRIDSGTPALTYNERQLLFDDTKVSEITPWLATKFAALAVIFLLIGLVEGVILPNLGFIWMALILLLTGGVATLLVAVCLRSGSDSPWILRHGTVGLNKRTQETPHRHVLD
jgi:hypothetical protein